MGRTSGRAIMLERDVAIPLRDGARASADIWRPADGAAGPAILIRTPYGREQAVPTGQIDPRLAVDRGYTVVVQDVRGRGDSDGDFEPYVYEADDGRDSVEWVAGQPWCDGRVVMGGHVVRGVDPVAGGVDGAAEPGGHRPDAVERFARRGLVVPQRGARTGLPGIVGGVGTRTAGAGMARRHR